jgi:hypothetical protein
MIYRGHIQHGVVVLDPTVTLPEGTEVRVELVESATPRTLAERFTKVIGMVDDLPTDMAENHDHYIHQAPKKP